MPQESVCFFEDLHEGLPSVEWRIVRFWIVSVHHLNILPRGAPGQPAGRPGWLAAGAQPLVLIHPDAAQMTLQGRPKPHNPGVDSDTMWSHRDV